MRLRPINIPAALSVVMVLTLFVISCSRELTYKEAVNEVQEEFDDPKAKEDATFLLEAKSINLLETQLTQLATSNGYAASVVNLGKENYADHEVLADDLDKVARNKKVKLPSEMSEKHQNLYSEVAETERQNFDKNFLRVLKSANEESTFKFTKMSTEASDEDIRAFAARKLGVLRKHEEKINKVEQELLRTF